MAWQSTLKLRKWPVVFHDDRSTPGMGKPLLVRDIFCKHSETIIRVALIFHTDRHLALIRLVAWFISQPWNKFLDWVTSDPALTANRNGGPGQHRLGMVKLRATSARAHSSKSIPAANQLTNVFLLEIFHRAPLFRKLPYFRNAIDVEEY